MLSTQLVWWTLATSALAATTTNAASIATPITTTAAAPPPPRRLSPAIVDELKDFLDLIPKATVDMVVSEHYVLDSNFRKALQFLRSGACRQLLQDLQGVPEVAAVLEFLHLLEGNSTSSSSSSSSKPPSSLTPAPIEAFDWDRWQLEMALATNRLPLRFELLPDDADDFQTPSHLRSFVSFVEELLRFLPRSRYVAMIEEKRGRNASFASFYAALRSADFAPMVEAALKSANLVKPLQTLSSNNVDVWSLKPIAFEVISWGPSP